MRARLTIGATLLIMLAACSPTVPSDPETTGPVPMVENRYGAPPVTSPRDLASRAADPCRLLLTSGQVEQLGYTTVGPPQTDILGETVCSYRDERNLGADVTFSVERDMLVGFYANRVFAMMTPTTIDGLPAVDGKSTPGSVTCTTVVAIGESQSIMVHGYVASGGFEGPPPVDPCDETRRVAEAVVTTLPPA